MDLKKQKNFNYIEMHSLEFEQRRNYGLAFIGIDLCKTFNAI